MILTARTDSLSGITRYSYYRTHDHEKKTPEAPPGEHKSDHPEDTDHPHHRHLHDTRKSHYKRNTDSSSLDIPPKFIVYWRTVSPEDYDAKTRNQGDVPEYFPYSWSSSLAKEIDPVKIGRSLGILPHEYPVLTGIFEFEFDETCSNVITHTITDLEYLTKPTTECINPA